MSIKFTLQLGHRPLPEENIQEIHRRFLEKQSELDIKEPWKIPDSEKYWPPKIKPNEISSLLVFNEIPDNKLKGQLSYTIRHPFLMMDRAAEDDMLMLDFDPNDVAYQELVLELFPKLVIAFDCYRAVIFGDIMPFNEMRKLVDLCNETGKDVNGRDGVYQFAPVSFFDRELCRRAFDLTPKQIVERLQDKVESVYEHENGVIIIYSSEILTREQLRSIDGELKPLLV